MTVDTSRSRFDERRRFSGVHQQMGRVALDSDWNEEVRIRATDARRRTADLAEGSPDDGFRITDDHLVDMVTSLRGWALVGLPADDERVIETEFRLDRYDPETLPWVLRLRGYPQVRRHLATPLDFGAVPIASELPEVGTFAASALRFGVRFERPPVVDELGDIRIVVIDVDGGEHIVDPGLPADPSALPPDWTDVSIDLATLTARPEWPDDDGSPSTLISGWGLVGLPPRARTWIGSLRAVDAALADDDFVIRGADGTLLDAGRILVDGVRAFVESDRRYLAQPDYPQPPTYPVPGPGQFHLVYLDLWHEDVTALDDDFLSEPALDGLDTTTRRRQVAQVRILPDLDDGAPKLPPPRNSDGRLTTNVPSGAYPDRYPPEAADPCRDRCLFTESQSVGEGYIGHDNLHVRVQMLHPGAPAVAVWSRNHLATVAPLTQNAAVDARTLQVSAEDAARFGAGDLIVVEDRPIHLKPEGPRRPVLRRLRAVDAATGLLTLTDDGDVLATVRTADLPAPPDVTPDFDIDGADLRLLVGGALGQAFSTDDRARIRRVDGADFVLIDVRYNLADGITFRFSGEGFRRAEYWSFTARVLSPDGAARGVVDQLTEAHIHGPRHTTTALACIRGGVPRTFEDVRVRYLPLHLVRDRLRELDRREMTPGAFRIVVGDGEITFGDVDQVLVEGVTGDEAIQAAVDRIGEAGGTVYIRAGEYFLEHPVLLLGKSRVRIIGDGDATVLRVVGAGGAFFMDRCGADGEMGIEHLHLITDPLAEIPFGTDVTSPPSDAIGRFFTTEGGPIFARSRALRASDLLPPPAADGFVDRLIGRLATLEPGEGRVADAIVETLIELRRIQRLHPGTPLEDLEEAQDLLTVLGDLPHGVITIADSQTVTVQDCQLVSEVDAPQAVGLFITGTCEHVVAARNRIFASSGIVAAPLASYLAEDAIAEFPRSGLFARDLRIVDNRIRPRATLALTGIHVADGEVDAVRVQGNLVYGFAIGVLVDDVGDRERPTTFDRFVIEANRIADAGGAGIQVIGDGADVVNNEIRLSGGEGMLQAGIQVAGQGLRVRDNWIDLPPAPLAPVLGVFAGIIVGDGLDAGSSARARSVLDVVVDGNRIAGAGSLTPGHGVFIGGPQVIFDVHIVRNLITGLGDAGVRAVGCNAPVGGIAIEDNEIEGVSLAPPPEADGQSQLADELRRLAPEAADLIGGLDFATPQTLLESLVDDGSAEARVPLDAVLRWIERLMLRGAICTCGSEGGAIWDNRVTEVGFSDRSNAIAGVDDEVVTAGVAAVGGYDVRVERNRISNVRAYVEHREPPGGETGEARPGAYDVLDRLGLGSAGVRVDRTDLHAASISIRRQVVDYLFAPVAERQSRAGLIFGPVEAFGAKLDGFSTEGARLAGFLDQGICALREATNDTAQGQAAARMRSSLSRSATITAVTDEAAVNWDAAARFDLASIEGGEALIQTAQTLIGELDGLVAGLDGAADIAGSLLGALEGVAEDPTAAGVNQVSALLGEVAEFRDAYELRRTQPTFGGLPAQTLTIISTLSVSLHADVGNLRQQPIEERVSLLADMRPAVNALVGTLQTDNPQLALDVQADFRAVERTVGANELLISRFDDTLGRVAGYIAQLEAAADPASGVDIDDVERDRLRAQAQKLSLYADFLDQKFTGLSLDSQANFDERLRILDTGAKQLETLVQDDSELAAIAADARVQIAAARGVDPTSRAKVLGRAQGLIGGLRRRLDELLPQPPLIAPGIFDLDAPARRLAGLGAVHLGARRVTESALRDQGLKLYQRHFEQSLTEASIRGGPREAANAEVLAAIEQLGRGGAGDANARANFRLMSTLDSVTVTNKALDTPTATLEAASVLIHACALALDTEVDEADRLVRATGYVRIHRGKLSPSITTAILQQADIERLLRTAETILERLARAESDAAPDDAPPDYITFPEAADGVFTAAVGAQIRIAGNEVQDVVRGIAVTGESGHVLADTPSQDGLLCEIGANRLIGCVLDALTITPGVPAVANVAQNQFYGCAGVGSAGRTTYGQAVATLEGEGKAVVQGNLFVENGHDRPRALLHELVVDWRGETVIRGNTIRHRGAPGGGAGVLVVAETIAADTVQDLARSPVFAVEAPPKIEAAGGKNLPKLDPIFASLIPDVLDTFGGDAFEMGAFKQKFGGDPPSHRALSDLVAAPATAVMSKARAQSYLGGGLSKGKLEIIGRLRRIPPLIFIPLPPPQQRLVHVDGNEVTAAGPALLLLAGGRDIVSATIVGNTLRAERGTGAAYVRDVDATVFTGNQCHCLTAVNVVVLRVEAAPVTATGNVVFGADPVTPPPAPKPIEPEESKGGAVLEIPVGAGAKVRVGLDAFQLVDELQQRTRAASQELVNITRATANTIEQPALGLLGAAPTGDSATGAAAAVTINTGTNRLSSGLRINTNIGLTTGRNRLVELIALMGVTDAQAIDAEATARITAAGGDVNQAVATLETGVFGDSLASEVAAFSTNRASMLHRVLADALALDRNLLADVGKVKDLVLFPKLPPDPHRYSLVVIGGTRVSAVANSTTAGVLLVNPTHAVELNP